ncbi:MAG TPA: VWA domain-containing protein [Mycobacteriales bacterium]|nr:VWA domain-containing protein [Mycobacteriales bacterium]
MAEGLVDREIGFFHALRDAGIGISLAEVLDATRALGTVDLLEREHLREAFAACVLKRPAHRDAFDTLFDIWFPPVLGDPSAWSLEPDADAEPGEGGESEPGDPRVMREVLKNLLLDGDEEAMRRFVRSVVNDLGRSDTAPGRQSWFSYRVLRALSPETLMASLLDAMLTEQQRGGLAEKVARQTVQERIRQFQEMVEAEVRRRLAEDRGVEQVSKTAVHPLAEQVDFLRATRADMAELRRQVFPLARRLATRLTARRRLGRSGRLDFRRTVRASLGTGGVPLVTHHKPHKPHKPELVVLCDVSGSVAGFAHFTLMLAYALREQFTKVRAFAFIDTVDEVTDFFTPGGDVADALARMSAEADLVWFDGHSDYGHSITEFAKRYPDAVGPRTSLLILGDARNNYRATGLQPLKSLVQRARHAYWLNPEPRAYWGSGDSATAQYAEVLEMVEVRNAVQLEDFVQRLLPT